MTLDTWSFVLRSLLCEVIALSMGCVVTVTVAIPFVPEG